MNRRQKWALWGGVALFVLVGLFPPWIARTYLPNGPAFNERSFHFIASKAERVEFSSIDVPVLLIEWAVVIVVGVAGVATSSGIASNIDGRK